MRMSYRVVVFAILLMSIGAQCQTKPTVVASFIPQPGEDSGFLTYIVPEPTIGAIMERYDWKDLEPESGVYDFSQIDSDIANWKSKGKQTVVLISLVTDKISSSVPNTSTPLWALNQMPQVTCPHLTPNLVPVMYDQSVEALTQPFILAVLKHLDTQLPWVLYVRIGFWEGGENCPLCRDHMPDGEQTMLEYLTTMSNFVHTKHPSGVMFTSDCSACVDTNYILQSGNIFVGDSMGIGQEDLAAQNANGQCPWCEVFTQHPTAYRYLQNASPQPDAAFLTYYPFAESYNTNAIELSVYPTLAIAYIPSYPGYTKWGAQYRADLSK